MSQRASWSQAHLKAPYIALTSASSSHVHNSQVANSIQGCMSNSITTILLLAGRLASHFKGWKQLRHSSLKPSLLLGHGRCFRPGPCGPVLSHMGSGTMENTWVLMHHSTNPGPAPAPNFLLDITNPLLFKPLLVEFFFLFAVKSLFTVGAFKSKRAHPSRYRSTLHSAIKTLPNGGEKKRKSHSKW